MTNPNIPIQACKRLLQTGNNFRVSKDASEELSCILEDTGVTIAETAYKFAAHAGRRTIRKEDVLLAVESLEE